MENPDHADPLPELSDRRRHAPATERNREPILAVLQRVLPPTGTVLEIASGTGQHAVHFAPALAPRHWLPSDPAPEARASITAWQGSHPSPTLHPPLALDVTQPQWPQGVLGAAVMQAIPSVNGIVAINLIHISPWAACTGLLAGAAALLPPGGILYLYGPYFQAQQPPAPSNEAFDASLRAQNPQWGIRTLEAVTAAAQGQGFTLAQVIPMPANNLSVVFCRQTMP